MEELLLSAPKPRPLTEARFAAMASPCLTVKLDGVRSLVIQDSRGTGALSFAGYERIHPATSEKLWVLDSERVGSIFFVFDVLFAA